MSRFVVVMAGPLPPAVGGMASVITALNASTLPDRVDLHLFSTGKTTVDGRPLWQGVVARLRLMAAWWRVFSRKPAPAAHIHTCSGLTFFLDGTLLLLSRLRGGQVVMHIHGARFDEFLDTLSPAGAALAHWLARRAAVVIVLSNEWKERLAVRWPRARLMVVANGVSMPTTAAFVGRTGLPRFVFLGNFGRRKGVHVLLRAAALAQEQWQVDLAGGEEEPGFTRWMEKEIGLLGLDDRVRVLGPVVGDAKDALLAAAQGFVLPSLAEGLPMALLEAMAAGLPVVVSDAGAMPEVVRKGLEGEIVPAEDAAALAGALDALARQPDLRQRLGSAAAERCRSLYGVERMVEALMGIYTELSGKHR